MHFLYTLCVITCPPYKDTGSPTTLQFRIPVSPGEGRWLVLVRGRPCAVLGDVCACAPWSLPPSIHALALEDSKTCESDICWERTCLDVHPFRTIFPTFSVPFLSHQDLFVPKIFPVVSPETKSAFSERILSLVEANSVSWELALSLSSSTLFLGE